LFRMRQHLRGLPTSLGGWHAFGPADYPTYAMAEALAAGQSPLGLLRRHPVWPLLRFIMHLQPAPTCALLATILDPRWYVDPARPDSLSRLKAYLGLSPTWYQRRG